nr:uncharacterized protein LOC114925946 [Arachis hypogaea]
MPPVESDPQHSPPHALPRGPPHQMWKSREEGVAERAVSSGAGGGKGTTAAAEEEGHAAAVEYEGLAASTAALAREQCLDGGFSCTHIRETTEPPTAIHSSRDHHRVLLLAELASSSPSSRSPPPRRRKSPTPRLHSPPAEVCVLWVTKGVEHNFGKEIKEMMSGHSKEKVIVHDTAVLGRPNVSEMSVNAANNFGAQVVIVTSNPQGI